MTIDEQLDIIAQGAEEIIGVDDLRRKLEVSRATGRPLIVKLGLDPTAPDIHLGHTVVLRKIRQLQALGHRTVLVIGDFTGRIGDPTGKSKARRQLTEGEVQANAHTYERQFSKILDPTRTELRFNSHWLGKMGFADVVALAARATVARMLEREDFKRRFAEGRPIGVHELLYPLMQAYDSVQLGADVELGGTDQRFNLLAGRELLRDYGREPQVALLMPLLEGLDGVQKMSKSLGNYIGVDEPPNDIFGKVMSLPDSLILRYFALVTDIRPDDLRAVEGAMAGGANPMAFKLRLAREITALYSPPGAADAAEEHFRNVFQRHGLPQEMPGFRLPTELTAEGLADIPAVLVRAGLAPSASEARRLLAQGGVRVNGVKISGPRHRLVAGDVLQAGKLRFVRIEEADPSADGIQ